MRKKLVFKQCKECGEEFMVNEDHVYVICDPCIGKAPILIDGAPNIGLASRLGENRFPQASGEWNDLLKKIKKENPGSNINVK